MIICSDTNFSIDFIGSLIIRKANKLTERVNLYQADKECDARNDILTSCNEINGMFHLLLELNNHRELPEVCRAVTESRQAVQELYFRRGRPPRL
jgi:hypothetical protein